MSSSVVQSSGRSVVRAWPGYRTVWRWHFYAGVFCIPFVIFLAVTGSIYLFKPQIESFLDRPYDHLPMTGLRKGAEAEVKAALGAFPGSTFSAYEMPPSGDSAGRVLIRNKGQIVRVYVHPETLTVMQSVPENSRVMKVIFRLHGELLMGNWGSYVVELAASWAILMIVSGLYLWWPRNAKGLGGVLYPRLFGGSRVFWRDVHGVVGFWVSAFALFMLVTGLPWAKFWGDYFKAARRIAGNTVLRQDWTNGSTPVADMSDMDTGEHAEHGAGGHAHHHEGMGVNLTGMDKVVAAVAPLRLAPPVMIARARDGSRHWTAKSMADNRTQRVDLVLDEEGAVLSRSDFAQRPLADRLVGTGIAAHEGQLFGWMNQLLGLMTAMGLVLLCVSAVVMWWRRREPGVLGAPKGTASLRLAMAFYVVLAAFAIYLPMFGISMVVVLVVEKAVLVRIARVREWLGLGGAAA